MKRVMFVVLLVLLVGCQKSEPTVQDLKAQALQNGATFVKDSVSQATDTKSMEYRKLFSQVYEDALRSLKYDKQSDNFSCQLPSVSSYRTFVQNDKDGFQKDVSNIKSLGLDAASINKYVYGYICSALSSFDKEEHTFELSLYDRFSSFESNQIIVDLISENVDALYKASFNLNDSADTVWEDPEKSLVVGKSFLLKVDCSGQKQNCLVKIVSVLKGGEARERINGISDLNSNLTIPDELVFAEYCITNLGTETVVYSDHIVSVDDGKIIGFDNGIVGLESIKKLEPLAETVITNVYLGSGSLLWYDNTCHNVFRVGSE